MDYRIFLINSSGYWAGKKVITSRKNNHFGCQSIKIPPRSPWKNPFVERYHLSTNTEMHNRLVLDDNNHVRELCVSYQDFYNKKRPHQGIGNVIPVFPDAVQRNRT